MFLLLGSYYVDAPWDAASTNAPAATSDATVRTWFHRVQGMVYRAHSWVASTVSAWKSCLFPFVSASWGSASFAIEILQEAREARGQSRC